MGVDRRVADCRREQPGFSGPCLLGGCATVVDWRCRFGVADGGHLQLFDAPQCPGYLRCTGGLLRSQYDGRRRDWQSTGRPVDYAIWLSPVRLGRTGPHPHHHADPTPLDAQFARLCCAAGRLAHLCCQHSADVAPAQGALVDGLARSAHALLRYINRVGAAVAQ